MSDPEGGVHLTEMSYIVIYGGFICHAMLLHPLPIVNIPRQKICEKYQYEEGYRPLKLQMCIETMGECTFHMALNC